MPKIANQRHEQFCQEYAISLNATEAYSRAYKREKDETSRKNGYKLLTKTDIQVRVKELVDLRVKRIEQEGDEFLNQLRYSALFDPREMFDFKDGRVSFKDFDAMPIQARRMIDGIKVKKIYDKDMNHIDDELDIKFVSKAKMKELWGKHQGAFVERVKIELGLDSLIGDTFEDENEEDQE